MQGEPLLKAKALLLAVAGILKQEDRSLHVILFGASGQLRTFAMDARNDAAGLLAFLRQGFNGGTDFETPLQHALHLVETNPGYLKADVLMVSDGDCSLEAAERFVDWLTAFLAGDEVDDVHCTDCERPT